MNPTETGSKQLARNLDQFLDRHCTSASRLLVGLSGGLDSVVLLDLLADAAPRRGIVLCAAHVHHGLSANADQWAEFCEELCRGYAIPCHVLRVSVARDSGLGLESAARTARYDALLALDCDALVLAHHRDDQAETLLLQLLRGAGLQGLAAMPEIRLEQGRALLRPLLDVPRNLLQAYANAKGLRWIEDESNLDLSFDRNFLRHHIFPELEQRFPASRTTLARSAAHLAEAAELLDEVARADAATLLRLDRLDIAGLRQLSAPRAKNLLRFWLTQHLSAPPSARRLQEIHRQLLQARVEAQLHVDVEGGQVRRYQGEAWFDAAMPRGWSSAPAWQGEAELVLAHGRLTFQQVTGAGLSLARLAGASLQIRFRQGHERLRPDSRRPARSLKYLMQEAGVPPWQRERLPLLYWRDVLVNIPGIANACEFQAAADEPGVLIAWQPAAAAA
jgi:tRNA(Ile)-lysidine synthase